MPSIESFMPSLDLPRRRRRQPTASTPTAILGSSGQPSASGSATPNAALNSAPAGFRAPFEIEAMGPAPGVANPARSALRPGRGRGASLARVRQKRRQPTLSDLLERRLPTLTPEQSGVANTILAVGLKRGVPEKHMLSAIQTGLVESNLTEIPGGDADSQNWRQERALGYADDWARTGGPLNTRASARRFFREAGQLDSGQPAGALAADVQRPREDLRYKYGDPSYTGAAPKIVNRFLSRVDRAGIEDVGRIPSGAPEQLPGPFGGSQRVIRRLIGRELAQTEDWKDKEHRGYDSLHDIESNPQGFAADLPAREDIVDRIARVLGRQNPGISPETVDYGTTGLEDGLTFNGYDIEFLPYTHGTGPHVHIGAEWTGGSTSNSTGFTPGGGASNYSGPAVPMEDGSIPPMTTRRDDGPMGGGSFRRSELAASAPLPEGFRGTASDEEADLIELLAAEQEQRRRIGTGRRLGGGFG